MSWLPLWGNIVDTPQYAVPTTGQTVVAGIGVSTLLLDPAGTIAALTVTLPSSPVDGQRFTVSSSAVITVLTINGGTIKGGIGTMSLNGFAKYTYSGTSSTWFRTG